MGCFRSVPRNFRGVSKDFSDNTGGFVGKRKGFRIFQRVAQTFWRVSYGFGFKKMIQERFRESQMGFRSVFKRFKGNLKTFQVLSGQLFHKFNV